MDVALEHTPAIAPAPWHCVLTDAGCGDTALREGIRVLGLNDMGGVSGLVAVWPARKRQTSFMAQPQEGVPT